MKVYVLFAIILSVYAYSPHRGYYRDDDHCEVYSKYYGCCENARKVVSLLVLDANPAASLILIVFPVLILSNVMSVQEDIIVIKVSVNYVVQIVWSVKII